jgi:hypothetical protein
MDIVPNASKRTAVCTYILSNVQPRTQKRKDHQNIELKEAKDWGLATLELHTYFESIRSKSI